jgi:hypothetical protein
VSKTTRPRELAGDARIDVAQRFTLDETHARQWLARAVSAYEAESRGDGDTLQPGEKLPEITADWEPRAYEQESTVYLLVRLAGETGIIAAPDQMELDFRYSDDSDGGYYCFHIGVGPRLQLASYSEEMRKLGDHDATGIDAALSILREAVQKANYTLDDLAELIAGLRMHEKAGSAVTDSSGHGLEGEVVPGRYSARQRRDRAANMAARFLPQLNDDQSPAVDVAGALGFIYVKNGALYVAVDLDTADPAIYRMYGDQQVPLEISVQGNIVFEAGITDRAG